MSKQPNPSPSTEPETDAAPKPGPATVPAATGTPESTPGPTEPQTAPETASDAATEPTDDTETEGGNKAGREAARYRKQLRETEAERDQLTGTVDQLRRQIIAAKMPHFSKINADSLWTAGHQPADMFTPDGALDVDKLTAATRETHQKFGIRYGADPVPQSGVRGEPLKVEPSWSDAIKR